ATSVPSLLILLKELHLLLLCDMYAFGLLGAFFFSSLSLYAIRWRLGRRDLGFWVGVLTTLMVMVAWGINLLEKHRATYFGGLVTLIGMVTAIGVRRAWFVDMLGWIPFVQRLHSRACRSSEVMR